MGRLLQLIEAWGRESLGSILRKGLQKWWGPQPVYPWPDEIQQAVHDRGAIRVCHRCLTPQEHLGWFCQKCGAATGPYNNVMPFVYIFSTGEVFRTGVDERVRFPKWVQISYFPIGAFEYLIFFPFYLFRLVRAKKRRMKASVHDEEI